MVFMYKVHYVFKQLRLDNKMHGQGVKLKDTS